MKFRTEVSILPSDYKISHKDKIMMLGSCFAENISSKLIPAGFNVESNPFGILYNPLSVANSIRSLLTRKSFEESDLFEHQGLYHSFSHHSRFSGLDKVEVLKHINRRTIESSDFLLETNYLIITFGSASVYSLVSSNEVVANCHKLPARMFNHNRLSVQEITDSWLWY
jgi:GSCFA family.